VDRLAQGVAPIRLAADVGGTFTDVVLDTGEKYFTSKIATTIETPETAILEGVGIVLQKAGIKPSQVTGFIHGTTLATNALIERKGARTALITTEGFRDSIEIAYESRYDQYDLALQKPEPLVPRYLRYTVFERVDVRGRILRPLDTASVSQLVTELQQNEIEAVAIGLLHSYANPEHEQVVGDMLRAAGVEAEISLSSEVCPEVREYERFMTTVCNAYVQPLMARYLRALQDALVAQGITCPLLLMTSGGGITTLDAAIRFPIRLVESGPSGGAVLASGVARQLREPKVLSYDMGGTTAKICLIDDYQPQNARNFEIARSARFHKGSGMPVRIPVVEMIEIGAGGGSIAHIDDLGRLTIGPESAGSTPGPCCYQKGGIRATVTDADLLLGKIDPHTFAEGRMQLDSSLAATALTQDIAAVMDVELVQAAAGIAGMVEENMANAARIHSVEHGANLSEYTMIAFGGAGPLHALQLAQKLNIGRIIVPQNSSVGSAVGFLWAPIAYEVVRSCYMTTQRFDAETANRLLADLYAEAFEVVCKDAGQSNVEVKRSAYMRYVGQGHEIEVPLPEGELSADDSASIQSSYEFHYQRLFGRTIPQRDIEFLSWSVEVSGPGQIDEATSVALKMQPARAAAQRSAYCPELKAMIDYPVYERDKLVPGNCLSGPALVLEAQTTTYIPDVYNMYIDNRMNLVIDRRST
jgi:N-methylhydantoinase A